MAPSEVPAGAVMAILGGPYLVWVLRQRSAHDMERRDGRRSSSAAPRPTPARAGWRRRSAPGCGGKGVSVAPFKAQNMSNNSYPCRARRRDRPRAGGAGRGVRARARAGDESDSAEAERQRHEPGRRQRARVEDAVGARVLRARRRAARRRCSTAYEDLSSRFDVIVIEGAGSVSELNLREHDLVNLGLVTRIRAPWLLVADIERGGVFGSVVGTVAPAERRRALAVSRLRDQQVPRRPVALRRRRADARRADGVALLRRVSLRRRRAARRRGQPGAADAADARRRRRARASRSSDFPHLSNATDFRLLTWADWITSPRRTATTSSSCPAARTPSPICAWLRESGLADWILEQHRARRDDHRHLRRLSDARPHDPRSGRHGVVCRRRRGTRACCRR